MWGSPTIGSDGTIYVGSLDGYIYAISPEGLKKWYFYRSHWSGGWITSSPAIGTDGTIYVGSEDNNLYAIKPNGREKWAFETGGDISRSLAIGSGGIIYFGSYDNKIYAYIGSYILSHPKTQNLSIGSSVTLSVKTMQIT